VRISRNETIEWTRDKKKRKRLQSGRLYKKAKRGYLIVQEGAASDKDRGGEIRRSPRKEGRTPVLNRRLKEKKNK